MKKAFKNTLLLAFLLTKVTASDFLVLGKDDYCRDSMGYSDKMVDGLKNNQNLEVVLSNPPENLSHTVPFTARHITITSATDGVIGKVGGKVYAEFSGRADLKSLKLPKDLEVIGDRALAGCESLESITIPDSVTCIGYRAFAGCKSLTTVTIPAGVKELGTEIFDGCDNLKTIYAPKELHEKLRKSLPEVDYIPYSTSRTLLLDGTESYFDKKIMSVQKTLASYPVTSTTIGTIVASTIYSSPMLQSAILFIASGLVSSAWYTAATIFSLLG